jgi:hypothetical protein
LPLEVVSYEYIVLVSTMPYEVACPATIKNGSRRQLEMTPGDNYKKRSSSG